MKKTIFLLLIIIGLFTENSYAQAIINTIYTGYYGGSIVTNWWTAIDQQCNIWLSGGQERYILKIDAITGVASYAVNSGFTVGYSGDEGLAATTATGLPTGLCFDATGNLYFCDRAIIIM